MKPAADRSATFTQRFLSFWFQGFERGRDVPLQCRIRWFAPPPNVDAYMCDNFESDLELFRVEKVQSKPGGYTQLESDVAGSLALVIMGSHLPRAKLRERIRANTTGFDPSLLLDSWVSPKGELSEQYIRESVFQAIHAGHHVQVDPIERAFYYLPLLRPEEVMSVEIAVKRLQEVHDEAPRVYRPFLHAVLLWAREHQSVMGRFGRYPQRNAIMNRLSTPEEVEYLRDEYPETAKKFERAIVGGSDRVWSTNGMSYAARQDVKDDDARNLQRAIDSVKGQSGGSLAGPGRDALTGFIHNMSMLTEGTTSGINSTTNNASSSSSTGGKSGSGLGLAEIGKKINASVDNKYGLADKMPSSSSTITSPPSDSNTSHTSSVKINPITDEDFAGGSGSSVNLSGPRRTSSFKMPSITTPMDEVGIKRKPTSLSSHSLANTNQSSQSNRSSKSNGTGLFPKSIFDDTHTG